MANSLIPLRLDQVSSKLAEFTPGDCIDPQFIEDDPQVAANTAAIANNATAIGLNTSAITDILSDVTTNSGDITALTAAIATVNSSIAVNASNITTNTGDIATNVANISTNTTAIANLLTALALTDSNVAVNTSAIAANVANIAANATAIASRVQSVTGTGNIAVNNADPINPVVSLAFEPIVVQNLVPQIDETVVPDLLAAGYAPYLTLVTPNLAAANYLVTVQYLWTYDSAANDFIARTTLNGDVSDRANLVTAHRQEPADSLGAGDPDEPIATAGTDQWHNYSYSRLYPGLSGVNTFQLEHAATALSLIHISEPTRPY